jgi:trimeric autotransporter adhesin
LGTGLNWSWQIGSGATLPEEMIPVSGVANTVPFDFSVAATSSGGPWLTVTPSLGNTSQDVTVTATANPAGLAPGTYNGTVTITPLDGTAQPVTIPATLNVIAANYVTLSPSYLSSFFFEFSGGDISPQTVNITSGAPLNFSVATQSSGNWLSATVTSTSTPATLTVAVNPAGLNGGTENGTIVITGPQNTITIPVSLTAAPLPQLLVEPPSLFFSAQVGGANPQPQSVNIDMNVVPVVTANTTSGGNWLSAIAQTQAAIGVLGSFAVTVNTAGLAAGTYSGTVTANAPGTATPVQVPVTLFLWSTPPTFTATPTSLTFSVASGSTSAAQAVSVQPSQPQAPWGLSLTGINAAAGIAVNCTPATCGSVESVSASPILPGAYYGTLEIIGSIGNVESGIPVTVFAGATAAQPPTIASIVSADTQLMGSVAPGEIVSIYGIGVGPAGIAENSSGEAATRLDSVEVLFDGKAAPLLYASPSQVNAIVPSVVAGEAMTTVQVVSNGIASVAWGVPVGGEGLRP